MKFLVAQKGAREHYAVAVALHQRRMLAGLVTDWYAPAWSKFGRRISGRFSSALAARTEDIPAGLVQSAPLRSLCWKWKARRAARRGLAYEGYLATDAAFGRMVARMKLPEHDVFFGYSYASQEVLEAEKRRGVFTVLDQIDPGPAHFRIVAEEMKAHPELAGSPGSFPEAYFERVRREWKLADVVVVNSEWTREAIISEGADAARIEVLPLAYDAGSDTLPANGQGPGTAISGGAAAPQSAKPLKVLWLGQVAPAKGIYYLVQAARLLEGEPVKFTVAGPLQIHREFVAAAPANIAWLGPVPRSETAKLYEESDVFILPTLSDGFAITQLEALSHGLPVITTPNCGRVVEEGKTGFIVPPRDAPALAEAIMRFIRGPALVGRMRPGCIQSAKRYSIQAYGKLLVAIIEDRRARNR